jgi:acyl-CoA dehydrogenase
VHEAEPVERKIKDAIKAKQLPRIRGKKLVEMATEKGIVTRDEAETIARAEAARRDAIQVDAFTLEEYMRNAVTTLDAAAGDGAPAGDGGPIPQSKGQVAYGAAAEPPEPKVKSK